MTLSRRLLTYLFAGAIATAVACRGQPTAPAMPPGLVLVARVTGTATLTVDGVATTLTVDAKIPPAALVRTQPNSSAVLVFSNGSTVQLGADTEVVLKEFRQNPFSAVAKVADLVEEPSSSLTRLSLTHGELTGDIKRLRTSQGSSFSVETPSDIVSLSNGVFRIVSRPTS